MKTCPSCGKEWPDSARFCPIDGTAMLEPQAPVVDRAGVDSDAAPAPGQFSETKWFKKGSELQADIPPEQMDSAALCQMYEKTSEMSPVDEKMFSLRKKTRADGD